MMLGGCDQSIWQRSLGARLLVTGTTAAARKECQGCRDDINSPQLMTLVRILPASATRLVSLLRSASVSSTNA
jgi:hypothetical protein